MAKIYISSTYDDLKDYCEQVRTSLRQTAVRTLSKHNRADPATLPLLRDRAENDPTLWLCEHAKDD